MTSKLIAKYRRQYHHGKRVVSVSTYKREEVVIISIKRVPLDFDYPQGKLWEGCYPDIEKLKDRSLPELEFIKDYDGSKDVCDNCIKIYGDCHICRDHCLLYNPDLRQLWEKEPPVGDGFQIWKTSRDGGPISPVFPTLEGLCTWLEGNTKVPKEIWMEMYSERSVFTAV